MYHILLELFDVLILVKLFLYQSNFFLWRFRNSRLFLLFSFLGFIHQSLTNFITLSGIRITLKTLLVTTLPDFKSNHFSDPCIFTEATIAMHPLFYCTWSLVTIAYVLASTYDPNSALQYFS